MAQTYIGKPDYLFDGERLHPSGAVLVVEAGIVAGCFEEEEAQRRFPDAEVENLQGILTPGFIDLQINGCGGVLFNDSPTEKTLQTMEATNWRYGASGFLPTLITDSKEKMLAALDTVKAYQKKTGVDRVLGIHLEGPYISKIKKGCHNEAFIRSPEGDEAVLGAVLAYKKEDRRRVCVMTLAPEHVEASTIRRLFEGGITVSIGHTNATEAQTKQAVAAGARMATHVYNAMSPISGGREGGALGAVLAEDSVYGGIIADGHHVGWSEIRIAKRSKGDKLFLVTDAATATGTDMKTFEFGGQTVYVKDGIFRNGDGSLASSSLVMSEGVRLLVEKAGLSLEESLRMATSYPAAAIGRTDLGVFRKGAVASFVLLNRAFSVQALWVDGRKQAIS